MNEKIKAHLIEYNKKNNWSFETDKDLEETLRESRVVYREITGSHRWYEDEFIVVDVDGMLIGYNWYHTTGDLTPREMDLDFDFSSVCEVEKKQKTVDYYERKNTNQ